MAAAQCSPGVASAEHTHVVVTHRESSVPACSATMNVAYQSGQSGSALPMRFSCSPWALATRRNAPAKSPTKLKEVVSGSTRPGRRSVISCSSQSLPSGSSKVANVLSLVWSGSGPLTRPLVSLGWSCAQEPGRETPRSPLLPLYEFCSPGVDVGHDEVETVSRPRCCLRDLGAKLNGAWRAGWRELDNAETVVEGEVGVEPPSETGLNAFERSAFATGITTASSFKSTLPLPMLPSASRCCPSVVLSKASLAGRLVRISRKTIGAPEECPAGEIPDQRRGVGRGEPPGPPRLRVRWRGGWCDVVIGPDRGQEPIRPAFENGDPGLRRDVVGAPADAVVFHGTSLTVVGDLARLEHEATAGTKALEEERPQFTCPAVQGVGTNWLAIVPVGLERQDDPVDVASAQGGLVAADDVIELVRSGSKDGRPQVTMSVVRQRAAVGPEHHRAVVG